MLVLLFFLSGALALIYQVVWQRQFAALLGSSASATAAVLVAFFAGLGAGSLLFGRWAARWARPLRAYAWLELGIGASALLVGPLLLGVVGAEAGGVRVPNAGGPGTLGLQAALAFLGIALPTIGMGGTLPVLARHLERTTTAWGRSVGRFYVANTAGAACGALATPFLLLPLLGMRQALWFCAGANALVALLAWRLDARSPAGEAPAAAASAAAPRTERPAARRAGSPSAAPEPPGRFELPALAAVSGGVTFALQVGWNRAFAQVHENSLHAYALIAALFILALALGGELARVLLRRGHDARRVWGWAWIAGGAATLAGPWLFVAVTGGLTFLSMNGGWGDEVLRLTGLAAGVIGPAVLLLGMGFPALLERLDPREGGGGRAADAVGRLLTINIAGCVAGAGLAGFALPAVLGTWGILAGAGAVAVVAGALQLGGPGRSPAAPKGRPWPAWLRAALAVLLVAPVFLASATLPRVRLQSVSAERLLALTEGPHGIVAVTERPGSRRLKLNNHYALGGTMALGDQRMQTHLPLLLHPAPGRVGHLGLGTGLSAGGILFHPVREVEVVELVPEVVAAARTHFGAEAAGLFTDSRVRLIIADARNHLRGRPAPYDVLIGDLVVPWREGEAALFTREHFARARASLRPGGVFCQWLPMFQLSEVEARILVRTFLSVFPQALVWRGDFTPDQPAIGLIGFVEPFRLDPDVVRRRLGELRPDPANPQLADPAGVWMNYVGSLEAADLDPAETRMHTEDRPWLELLGPRTHRRAGQSTLFTGRTLQRWLAAVRERSAARAGALRGTEREAAVAGDFLFEFSLALEEGDTSRAIRLKQEVEKRLPAAVVRSVFGPPGGGG